MARSPPASGRGEPAGSARGPRRSRGPGRTFVPSLPLAPGLRLLRVEHAIRLGPVRLVVPGWRLLHLAAQPARSGGESGVRVPPGRPVPEGRFPPADQAPDATEDRHLGGAPRGRAGRARQGLPGPPRVRGRRPVRVARQPAHGARRATRASDAAARLDDLLPRPLAAAGLVLRRNVLRCASGCAHAYVASPSLLDWLRDHPFGTAPFVRLAGTGIDAAYAALPGAYAFFPMLAAQSGIASDHLADGAERKLKKPEHLFSRWKHRELLLARLMRPNELVVAALSPLFYLMGRFGSPIRVHPPRSSRAVGAARVAPSSARPRAPGAGSRHRLAFLLDSLEAGGVQRMTLAIARCCRDRGHAVDLLVCRTEGPLARLDPGRGPAGRARRQRPAPRPHTSDPGRSGGPARARPGGPPPARGALDPGAPRGPSPATSAGSGRTPCSRQRRA